MTTLRAEWLAWAGERESWGPPQPPLAPQPPPPGGVSEERARAIAVEELARMRRGPAFCRGPGSAVYHGVASAHPLLPPELHESLCGWKFGVVPEVTRFDNAPIVVKHRVAGLMVPIEPCKKCWRDPAVAPGADGAG